MALNTKFAAILLCIDVENVDGGTVERPPIVRKFVLKSRYVSFVRELILDGIKPLREFNDSDKECIFVRRPIFEGIVPLRKLFERVKFDNEFNVKIPLGMLPVSLLLFSGRYCRLVNAL